MTHVAFLRAINVGGTSIIRMADLVKVFEGMGFTEVKTYIQSGNAFFDTKETDTAKLEKEIANAVASTFEAKPEIMVRTLANLESIVHNAPLSPQANKGGWGDFSLDQLGDNTKLSLYVAFLKSPLTEEQKKLLDSFENEHEKFVLSGKDIYCLITKNVGKVGVYTRGTFEKKLGIPMTIRNYLTMEKMLAWHSSLRA